MAQWPFLKFLKNVFGYCLILRFLTFEMFSQTTAGIIIGGVPHQIVHTAVSVDPQREVHRYQ